MHTLYDEQTANDTSKSNAIVSNGTRMAVHAYGTWDGATMSVYLSLNGTSNGMLLDGLTFTEDSFETLPDLPPGVTIWATLASAGGSTSVSLKIA